MHHLLVYPLLYFFKVFVKLSMLGYAVPGWHAEPEKEEALRGLVPHSMFKFLIWLQVLILLAISLHVQILQVVAWFGAERCMFASNFHINGAVSDSDGLLSSGPSGRAISPLAPNEFPPRMSFLLPRTPMQRFVAQQLVRFHVFSF